MKILIFTNNDGGLYQFRKELLEKLLAEKHSVYVSMPFGKWTKDIENLGCKCIQTEFNRRGKNPFKDLYLLFTYRDLLKKVKPDCVLTYTIKPNIYGGIACTLHGIPYIANVTGLGTAIEKGGILTNVLLKMYKYALKSALCVFYQNAANKSVFEDIGITAIKTRLIPGSGINTEKYDYIEYPANKLPLNLLFIGRVMEAKGINELIAAIKVIRMTNKDIRLHVLGYCEDGYEAKVEKWQSEGLIEYHGEQKDVRPFIAKCDALIHPSYCEGMSNVCLEAAATGRPVLATDIPGCREIVDDGITGFLFEPKSSQSIVTALNKFMSLNYGERKEMGRRGREKVKKNFDRNIVINAYMQEINNIKMEA